MDEQIEPDTPSRMPHWRMVFDQAGITSEVANFNYQGSGTKDDPYLVKWLPNDPRNPMLFGEFTKWLITITVAIATLAVALVSSAYSGGASEIIEEFGTSDTVAILGISLFVVGFAVGPLLWAPLSEMYGRQILFFGTYAALTSFNAGCAGAQNIETLIICRFFAGAFGSSPLTNAGGVIADMFPASQRGQAMAIFAAAPFLGPVIGPIVGGFLGAGAGWRWVMGFLAAFSAYPIVYQQNRGWSAGIGGLAFIGILIGMIFAIIYTFPDNQRYIRAQQTHGGFAPPETRLIPTMVGSIFIPIGLFWFAWTNYPNFHWAISIAAGAPFGFGMVLVFLSVMNYLVDAYTIYAASVLAATSVLRSLFGAAFPLFTKYMYANLGIHWASSIPAFLALMCVPFPFLFYKYGPAIRQKCKYAAESAAFVKKMQDSLADRQQGQRQAQHHAQHHAQQQGESEKENEENRIAADTSNDVSDDVKEHPRLPAVGRRHSRTLSLTSTLASRRSIYEGKSPRN
ncbi:major facilitator superfamily transporter [Seiridium cupressi]